MPVLTIRAGARALKRLREHGLDPADIAVLPGAAGGPKALGLLGLDLAIFGEWLPRAPRVRDLVGASIGAWRFAAVCRNDPVVALGELAKRYSEQRYARRPGAAAVSQSARELLAALFRGREQEVLSNPGYRLHVLAVRGRWPLTRDSRMHTPIGFGLAALANVVGRRHLAHFLDRTVFHDPRGEPPFLRVGTLTPAVGDAIRFDAFHTHAVPLDSGNLGEALIASASIPLVLEGVPDIPRAPGGIYWDGGIIDYHLHLPYHRSEGLVLYPHFTDAIVPGWLDKGLPWRRARGEWLDNVVLVSPSREYLAKLPHGKLPDRNDFRRYVDDYGARLAYWRLAMAESARLGEAFLRFAGKPDMARVLPL
jgi:hypothetical protein